MIPIIRDENGNWPTPTEIVRSAIEDLHRLNRPITARNIRLYLLVHDITISEDMIEEIKVEENLK